MLRRYKSFSTLSIIAWACLSACNADGNIDNGAVALLNGGSETAIETPIEASAHDCQSKKDKNDCQQGLCPQAQAVATPIDYKAIDIAGSPRKGGQDPEVTIVLASEFECPFCTRINPTVQLILQTYGDRVAVVYKHNPLPFHQQAMSAAVAAEAAHRQGRFWEMYELLFAQQKNLGADLYLKLAEKLGLDLDVFKKDIADPELEQKVREDMELVKSLGGRGVPNLWINGQHVVGAQPFASIRSIIDAELGK